MPHAAPQTTKMGWAVAGAKRAATIRVSSVAKPRFLVSPLQGRPEGISKIRKNGA
jgi:hypothetical protein